MKKYLLYSLALFFILFCVGCSDDDDENITVAFKVLSVDRSYTSAGGEGEITVSEEGVEVSANVDWLKASVSGKKIELIVAENINLESRTAKVVLSKKGDVQNIAIIQQGYFEETDIVSGSYDIPSDGTEVTYLLKTSVPILVTLDERAKEWVSYKVNGDNIVFTFKPTPYMGKTRVGNVAIETADWIEKRLHFTQQASFVGTYEMYYLNHKSEEKVGACTIEKASVEGKYVVAMVAESLSDFGGIPSYKFLVNESGRMLLLNETQVLYIEGDVYVWLRALYYFKTLSDFDSIRYFSLEKEIDEANDKLTVNFIPHGSYDSGPVDAIMFAKGTATNHGNTALGTLRNVSLKKISNTVNP